MYIEYYATESGEYKLESKGKKEADDKKQNPEAVANQETKVISVY